MGIEQEKLLDDKSGKKLSLTINLRMASKILYLFIFIVLAENVATAQQSQIVTGQLIDSETKQTLPYANVMLCQPADTSFITGTMSGKDGIFELNNIPESGYLLQISYIGYQKKFIPFQVNGKEINLGKILLIPQALELGEVGVTAEKEMLSGGLTKETFAVAKNIANSGASILDAMKILPGVTVNIEGKVSLRGSDKVAVLVDGKQSALTGASRTASLNQIPASAIETIEVITNPSAKYDPDGMAGIINLIFKKEEKTGANGEIGLTLGTDDEYNPSISMNYRRNRINLFANYDGLWRKFNNRNIDLLRTDYSQAEVSYLRQNNYADREMKAHTFKAGLDLFLNHRNTLTYYTVYETEHEQDDGYIDYRYFDANNNIQRLSKRSLSEPEDNKVYDYALLYKLTFDQPDEEFNAGVIYSSAHELEKFLFENLELDLAGNPLPNSSEKEDSDLDELVETTTIQADYVKPLNNQGKIEAGYKSILREITLDFVANVFDYNQNQLVNDPSRTDNFNYREQIHAGYGLYASNNNKFSYELGARLEQVFTKSVQQKTKHQFKKDYFRIYPNIKFGLSVGNFQQLLLSYSGRVNRPDFNQLNIVPKYIDPLNLEQGNPELNPEYVHSGELGFKKIWQKSDIKIALFYRHINDPIQNIITIDTAGVAYYVPQNLSGGSNRGLEFLASRKLFNWWKIDGNVSIFENMIFEDKKFGVGKQNDYSWNAKIISTNKISNNWEIQLNGYYLAPHITPQGKTLKQYAVDLGISKQLFHEKGKLSFKFSDLFNTLKLGEEINGKTFTITSSNNYETRIGYLSFNYKF